MDDLASLQKNVTRITFLFLSVCFIGWALLPAYSGYFSGLIIGTIASLISYTFLAWKVRQATDAMIKKTNRKVYLGYLTRAAIALLAVVITLRYPQIELTGTIIGLFFTQMTTLSVGLLYGWKGKK